MSFARKSGPFLAAAVLSAVAWNAAVAQPAPAYLKEGAVYSVHSIAQHGCPTLDWHIWVGPQDTLQGMISTEGVTPNAYAVKGAIGPNRTFHLDGKQIGGAGATGSVDGTVRDDGTLVATMSKLAPSSPCNDKTVYVKWFRRGNDAYDSSRGAAGGG